MSVPEEELPAALNAIRADAKSRRRYRLLEFTCGGCGILVAECFDTDPRTAVFPGGSWTVLDDGDLVPVRCKCGNHYVLLEQLRRLIDNGKTKQTAVPRPGQWLPAPPELEWGDLVRLADEEAEKRIRKTGRRRGERRADD